MSEPVTPSRTAMRDLVNQQIRRRYAAETRFRWFGIAMVSTAIAACALLLLSVMAQSVPALTENRLHLTIQVTPDKADPLGKRVPSDIREQGNFYGMVQDGLIARFPTAEADGTLDDLFDVVTSLAAVPIGRTIAADPSLIGKSLEVSLPINDDLDLFLKGAYGKTRVSEGSDDLTVTAQNDGSFVLSGGRAPFAKPIANLRQDLQATVRDLETALGPKQQRLAIAKAQVETLKARALALKASEAPGLAAAEALADQAETTAASLADEITNDQLNLAAYKAAIQGDGGAIAFSDDKPTILVERGGATYKLTRISANAATGVLLIRDTSTRTDPAWRTVQLATPQNGRAVNDEVIAFGRQLQATGAIKPALNTTIFTRSDSNEPELAGILSALVGTILTLLVTFCTAVPIGVATAVYLEEFAPKNALTDFIEVNINNLAAVPSIVFGLLGFAVFLTFFNMPRSAPIVGGIVLTLMSLPVIIIASRAALKSVPPSIREAALGVGASRMQAVFHHVLPLAMPGIMTGSILAMAHALGETAPLLMIGMVAFIADIPTSFTDSATVLPVELFMWAGRPERAWEPRTAMAILILLLFMILMNAVAIFLRRKFERRW
ncbi:phosphate transport system permease protein PstA [Candidatus Phycosocius bacilliformis]|uniref:Phosphate transport system permease protein PstA n=1 Tax=Candidatus Phycosocius bacilliformis TaxID=1445552 RepID=A0A2P2E8S2_9PROT|nr:phosphate ABC transporter permease PstA [Candidatus Phycosocius bacilliformis]GBF57473.1 phosphate transport system permease protein PstA [Candidatus Phycosocius bacilliformis]